MFRAPDYIYLVFIKQEPPNKNVAEKEIVVLLVASTFKAFYFSRFISHLCIWMRGDSGRKAQVRTRILDTDYLDSIRVGITLSLVELGTLMALILKGLKNKRVFLLTNDERVNSFTIMFT